MVLVTCVYVLSHSLYEGLGYLVLSLLSNSYWITQFSVSIGTIVHIWSRFCILDFRSACPSIYLPISYALGYAAGGKFWHCTGEERPFHISAHRTEDVCRQSADRTRQLTLPLGRLPARAKWCRGGPLLSASSIPTADMEDYAAVISHLPTRDPVRGSGATLYRDF